ncbi:MAG: hypothetical protein JW725_05105 [Candidatus Babeliaceae bacterium]|nr:hypothetical protein [Candidatus Babeliaceae bacterium]
MKNSIILALAVLVLVVSSMYYKESKKNLLYSFPNISADLNDESLPSIFLYFFFSNSNCRDCMQVMEVFDEIPGAYILVGVAPEVEIIQKEPVVREFSKKHKVFPFKEFKKFLPYYTPHLIGVSSKGRILFSLPCVPGEKAYLIDFLKSFYNRIYPHLM